jgi:hypothetical protein
MTTPVHNSSFITSTTGSQSTSYIGLFCFVYCFMSFVLGITTTTSSSSNPPTMTTYNSSESPTTPSISTTLPITTTSSNSAPCPPILLDAKHVNVLSSIDNTVWGSWYLYDVSVKENDNTNREVIDNGGLETGNLGSKWRFCDLRYSWFNDGTVVDHTSHSGRYSYESKDLDVDSQEYLTQIFNLKSNTRYRIEFYIFYIGEPILAL